tara:strand:- start:1508 stop:1822 length:315 start_codon:yes stop_codon:yes gene_type:complete
LSCAVYRNRYGTLKAFQIGAWIDRAVLSRNALLECAAYRDYDARVQAAYREAVGLARAYEGTSVEEPVDELTMIASNLLDSRLRCAPRRPSARPAHILQRERIR